MEAQLNKQVIKLLNLIIKQLISYTSKRLGSLVSNIADYC